MSASTLTFADAKSRAEDLLDIDDASSDLNEKTVVIAVQDFLGLYQPEEMLRYPEKWVSSGTFTPNSGGINQIPLSSISADLYGTKKGFKVRMIDKFGTQIFQVRRGGPKAGFYVENGVLYLYGFGDTQVTFDLYIEYYKKPAYYSVSSPSQYFSTTPAVIPIEQGLEQAIEFYIAYRYTERDQGDPAKASNYRNNALREMQQFFTLNRSVVAL